MQKGNIELRGTTWLLRYREPVIDIDGKEVMRPTSCKLATYSEQYRTEKSVRALADQILAPINAKISPAETVHTLKQFVELIYLPAVKKTLKPSTACTYLQTWRYIAPHTNGEEMRLIRTSHIDKLLRNVTGVDEDGRLLPDREAWAHTTIKRMKQFLSGVFREARRRDLITHNPVRDAKLPRGKAPVKVPANTLDDLVAMLKVLPEPARTAVLIAGLTGLRVSEIAALRWEDYDGETLNIQRSFWKAHISDTKTLSSKAPVPVVAPVRAALEAHRRRVPGDGYIFTGERYGRPLWLDNVLHRTMLPALRAAGIKWNGWHAFRRGVGTILNQLGADPTTIQAILRHSNVSTTMTFYVKPIPASSVKAMNALAAAFGDATSAKLAQ